MKKLMTLSAVLLLLPAMAMQSSPMNQSGSGFSQLKTVCLDLKLPQKTVAFMNANLVSAMGQQRFHSRSGFGEEPVQVKSKDQEHYKKPRFHSRSGFKKEHNMYVTDNDTYGIEEDDTYVYGVNRLCIENFGGEFSRWIEERNGETFFCEKVRITTKKNENLKKLLKKLKIKYIPGAGPDPCGEYRSVIDLHTILDEKFDEY